MRVYFDSINHRRIRIPLVSIKKPLYPRSSVPRNYPCWNSAHTKRNCTIMISYRNERGCLVISSVKSVNEFLSWKKIMYARYTYVSSDPVTSFHYPKVKIGLKPRSYMISKKSFDNNRTIIIDNERIIISYECYSKSTKRSSSMKIDSDFSKHASNLIPSLVTMTRHGLNSN